MNWRNNWVSFYPKFGSDLFVEAAGYFDERPVLHISLTQLIVLFTLPFLLFVSLWFLLLIPFIFIGWGKLYIHLPIKTGIDDCESAAWGFAYHDNTIWIYIGGAGNFDGGRKYKSFYMPWHLEWVRTSTLMKDGYDWFHETKGNRKSWEEDIEGNIIGSYDWLNKNKWQETHDYLDNYDETIVKATISVVEREWRPKAFKWTKLFAKTVRVIDIEFSEEVGRKKGSWKGGCIGCSYNLLPKETPHDCLKRMQNERTF